MILLVFLSIVVALVLISKFKINTFLVLFGMAVLLGLLAGFEPEDALKTVKAGFGHTLEKIGLLIIFGVILGEILDRTNATKSIANYIIAKLGSNRTDLAMLSIGFLVGLPIFCDSGFIVLSGLLFHLGKKDNFLTLALCLAGGLYSVHCLVPPHPGITAAASQLSLDLGKTMLYGTLLAIPSTVVAFFWARASATLSNHSLSNHSLSNQSLSNRLLPPVWRSFLPIWLPIFLMALKAVWPLFVSNKSTILVFIGDPVVALLMGILVSLPLLAEQKIKALNDVCEESFGRSGHILAIVAAGGMFGEVVKKILTDNPAITQQFLTMSALGLFLPYILTLLFKTAQGSSTVAVMSVAAIMEPVLDRLGIDRQMALFAMGAGSMAISHSNDAYFWVVTRFAKLPTNLSLKTYTPLSFLMSISTFLVLWLISIFS